MCATFKPVQAQTFYLAGSGATIGDTTIVLSSFKQIDGTTNLLTADFGSKGYATMEPNNSTQEEQISFTTVTQNINGTATLSGVKTVLFVSPYTETSGLAKSHPGGSAFIISNTSKFYDDLLAFDNDETVSGLFTFSQLPQSSVTPSDDKDLTTKVYVDSGILAGAANMGLTTKGIGEEATAAEINAGTQAGTTLAELIVNPKYLKDSNYYLFLPTTGQKDALAGSSGTPGAANRYITEDDVSAAGVGNKIVRASTTTLPALSAANLTNFPFTTWLFGGDGSDGALDTSGGTVDIALGGAKYVVKNYTTINVATNNLTVSNPHANGTILVLKSQGNVTISSSIVMSGAGAAGGAGGIGSQDAGDVGIAASNFDIFTSAGSVISGRGGTYNSSGGAGGTKMAGPIFSPLMPAVLPGSGGGGGASGNGVVLDNGGAGGAGGGALYMECGGALNFTGTITVAGVVGTNGEGNNATASAGGAGGGGAGGSALILWNTLTSKSGTVTVIGGAGGNGGGSDNSGTGGSGGGGGSSSISAGGAGGAAGSSAASDGSAATIGGAGGTKGSNNGAGGGGGGGASGWYAILPYINPSTT